jgi:hypothetical protein
MMEDEMLKHNAIGSCCSRPRFNFVGGVDDEGQTHAARNSRKEWLPALRVLAPFSLLERAAKMGRSIAIAMADFGKR